MALTKSPCKECDKHSLGCKSSCIKYTAYEIIRMETGYYQGEDTYRSYLRDRHTKLKRKQRHSHKDKRRIH